uniref:Uncharacterized protein AlNc14C28G2672 n=1 Tax=Albugo laibachii Nc14 TaxID=890382 RepID=F0W743_9STRA|nr:conserved hypothetical protein [Albugo laibachii Nc14]|eukprot:CCA16942.1 conserved hypothetical protein [Albugo laibachii Nc14]
MSSLFQVGNNVELWRVLMMLSLLVFCVILLEQVLHHLERRLNHKEKYNEMLRKVYRELMVLGLIGLSVKLLKEMMHFADHSLTFIAFEVADMMIFVLAIALVFQSLCIYIWLRKEDERLGHNEVLTAQDLLELINAKNERKNGMGLPSGNSRWPCGKKSRLVTKSQLTEIVEMRTLRHFFLTKYQLPEIFPFSSYLKHAQDNKIAFMIDVDISTWVLLLFLLFCLNAVAKLFQDVKKELEPGSILRTFSILAWLLFILHVLVATFLANLLNKIVEEAGYNSDKEDVKDWLVSLAELERLHQADEVDASKVIAVMRHVEEVQERIDEEDKRYDSKCHDSGIQLVYRCVHGHHKMESRSENREDDAEDLAPRPTLRLAGFNVRVWELLVRLLLMFNGFYLAIFFECILYQFNDINQSILIALVLFPLPILLNMVVLQPRIFRNFMFVSSVFSVDVAALSETISHFTSTVEARADFIGRLRQQLIKQGKTCSDMERLFSASDPLNTGEISIEKLREVLNTLGSRYSASRFQVLATLAFRVERNHVQYCQVLRLLNIINRAKDEASGCEVSTYRNCVMLEEHAERMSQRQSIMAGHQSRASVLRISHMGRQAPTRSSFLPSMVELEEEPHSSQAAKPYHIL